MLEGRRNFKQCSVKEVNIVSRDIAGYVVRLDCPRTESASEKTVTSQARTLKFLAENQVKSQVCQLFCRTCVYAAMNPLEVEQARIQQAQTRATRIETEAEALRVAQAFREEFGAALALGQAEVAAIEQQVDARASEFPTR